MWRVTLVLWQLSAFAWTPAAQGEDAAEAITPQDCSLDCIRQGGAACEYCRITRTELRKTLGLNSPEKFGSCIPWPCLELLGGEDPKICQHYVQAPNEVTVEFVHEPNPESDTVVVSWKPSYYGIAFLRGFQVSLQALGGSSSACQLFLFRRNLSLPASHAQRVYRSDPFPGLALGSQYAVTVMALPVPEEWEKFYHSEIISTRSCAEKNGLEKCKKDWYPRHIEVQQNGTTVTVTFNLAPPDLGIRSYFSLCYANGLKKYTDIKPNSSKNKTHHSYELKDLEGGTNYTCEIAANEMDAVRKMFNIQVPDIRGDGASADSHKPSLALLLPLCIAMVTVLGVGLVALARRKPKSYMKTLQIKPDIIKQHEESGAPEEVVSLQSNRPTPPRLLICYSGRDGAAHVRVVMQLGAFIQQHMATQVLLDLWDSLSVSEEGSMAWYSRQIQESDFILVVCSRGLNRKTEPPKTEWGDEDEEEEEEEEVGTGLDYSIYSSDTAVQLVREEVVRAKARGQDLSKYMAAVFVYSEETDVPAELRLASHYALPRDFPLLFSHLHGVSLHRPGSYLKINHISEEGFAKLASGAALQSAIYEAGAEMKAKRQRGEGAKQ
ncbi:interleukin-17 receptor D [Mugil cephalus]|uniref:interleukin-17 receptor D n=1 Tax=Mugil cephalus TaxID=48193 RepID=UPI001FB6BF18|nr:interleukin-17 receptor D [Mugil cephalus]